LFGNGEETRDHLYVDDAVDLILKTALRGSTGVLNLVTGKSESFRAVADLVAAQAGRPIEIVPSARQNPATHRHFDVTNLLQAFPETRFKPLADGLAATVGAVRG
jgi:ADP-L-glycero-D-manno-heptose 6-epimerase